MKKVKMIATNGPQRPLTYAGRALRSGQEFDASRAEAQVLAAVGLARYADKDVPRKAAVRSVAPPAAGDALNALRARYEALAGKKAHAFWREKRVSAEIAALEQAAAAPKAEPQA